MGDGPDAVVFDLDGVLTFTAHIHLAVWKELFDDFLRQWNATSGEPFRPFQEADYYTYVDGKPRYAGVLSFLRSRAIQIPYGDPSNPPSEPSVCGLGNRKNDLFNRKIREIGVSPDEEAVRLVRELRSCRIRTGVASSSKNAVPILEQAGIRDLFDGVVDGIVSERLLLRGKPEPDIFLLCLSWLTKPSLQPKRAAVVEDSMVGVQAGRLGGFGLVLGVDRSNSGALERHGADWVIRDFRKITAEKVLAFFTNRKRVA